MSQIAAARPRHESRRRQIVKRLSSLDCCGGSRHDGSDILFPRPQRGPMIETEFEELLARRMRAEHKALAARWFERLFDMLPVDARSIFPTDSLLDHVPALIVEISEYLRDPAADAIAGNTAILEKARELGALRFQQHASLHQVLREYQILGGVLVTFVQEEIGRMEAAPTATESVALVARLHQAVNVLSQSTVETFVQLYTETIADQTSRLEEFTRMATHEWR